jgi:GntR family transcriptional regulator, transcriptional repressor for pyruvate dehydrogenase complex
MERVELSPAYELVVERIRRAIHIGTYIPGDKLPPERALADQLGVSRTTLREAVRVLASEGYVESRRGAHGGLVVLDQVQKEDAMRPVVRRRFKEFGELIEYRMAVECAAARLAAARRTKRDLERLARACATMERGFETGRFRAADSDFHLGIADAARNRFMRQTIEDARSEMWLPIDSLIRTVFRTANEHHAQILDAIRDRDPDKAEEAVAAHLDRIRFDLRRTVADDGAGTTPRSSR